MLLYERPGVFVGGELFTGEFVVVVGGFDDRDFSETRPGGGGEVVCEVHCSIVADDNVRDSFAEGGGKVSRNHCTVERELRSNATVEARAGRAEARSVLQTAVMLSADLPVRVMKEEAKREERWSVTGKVSLGWGLEKTRSSFSKRCV